MAALIKPESYANLFLIAGGCIFAVSPVLSQKWYLFTLFLAGHLIWAWHGMRVRDNSLIALNSALLILDAYAIAIRIAQQGGL